MKASKDKREASPRFDSVCATKDTLYISLSKGFKVPKKIYVLDDRCNSYVYDMTLENGCEVSDKAQE